MDKLIELSDVIDNLAAIAKEKNISFDNISKKTGILPGNVSRFFSKKQSPTLRTLIIISNAIGIKIKLENL